MRTPTSQLDFFVDSLPAKPYCTDNLEQGLLIRPKVQAMEMKYIQPNTPWNWTWITEDVDRETGASDWYDRGCPAPNVISENPNNGHAHLFYGLATPIHLQDGRRNKPFRYASAISVALTKQLGADPAYSGLISKNPLNEHWNNDWLDPKPYTLDGLASFLDLTHLTDARQHLPEIGLGRNCTLFDVTRFWSYREIRKPQGWLCEDFFISAVKDYAFTYNEENFAIKLPRKEIETISKSIGKWTYRNMSPQGFRDWGDGRRSKSVRVRKAGSFEKEQMVKLYKEQHPDARIREMAKVFGYSTFSISEYLRR